MNPPKKNHQNDECSSVKFNLKLLQSFPVLILARAIAMLSLVSNYKMVLLWSFWILKSNCLLLHYMYVIINILDFIKWIQSSAMRFLIYFFLCKYYYLQIPFLRTEKVHYYFQWNAADSQYHLRFKYLRFKYNIANFI